MILLPCGRSARNVFATAPRQPSYVPDATFTGLPVGGTVFRPNDSAELTTALATCVGGDIIVLRIDVEYVGNFVCRARGDSGVVFIVAAGVKDGGFPKAAGQRIIGPEGALVTGQSEDTAELARVLTPNSSPALMFPASSAGYRFIGIDVGLDPSCSFAYSIIADDPANLATSRATMPSDIGFDRCIVRGRSDAVVQRGMVADFTDWFFVGGEISEIHRLAADSGDCQAIVAWQTERGLIENNLLSASGEITMFGGADPAIPLFNNADVTIRYNHYYKPLRWIGVYGCKNLFELKHAVRFNVHDNVFENTWDHAQHTAILFQAVSQSDTAPWSKNQDIRFCDNLVRNAPGGFDMSSRIYGEKNRLVREPSARVLIQGNLFERIGTDPGGLTNNYAFITFLDDWQDVTWDHNTWVGLPSPDNVYAMVSSTTLAGRRRIRVTNNIGDLGYYGFAGDMDGITGDNNVFFGRTIQNGAGTYATANLTGALNSVVETEPTGVHFTDWANGDYHLTDKYRGFATDGTDPGCNIDAIRAMQSQVTGV